MIRVALVNGRKVWLNINFIAFVEDPFDTTDGAGSLICAENGNTFRCKDLVSDILIKLAAAGKECIH